MFHQNNFTCMKWRYDLKSFIIFLIIFVIEVLREDILHCLDNND
jgi:hypothetical protein